MGLELEDEVADVGEEQDDGCSSREDEQAAKRAVVRSRGVGGEGDGPVVLRGVVLGSATLRLLAVDSHAAGMMSVMHARVMSDELAWAAVAWKVDS